MKKHLFIIMASMFVCMSFAQEQASRFTDRNNDQPRDPRMDQMNYVPNEILIKFKDETTISTASKIKAAGITTVDQVLKNYGITSLERLFPNEMKPARAKVMRSPQGTDLKVPALDKIYRITVPVAETPQSLPVNIHQIIEELKALPEVEYAEPNYIYSIDQLQPIGPELTADDVARLQNNKYKATGDAVVPNDPLYSQQGYIQAVKANLVWEQTTGDTTQVIAILDTGVDWTHPDLKNKIWRNWGEIPNNGIDEDGNGLIDDYMGWDFIHNDNNPMDDNSHGTHVAGIAAAEANNGIGIAGVNWHAKIMPVKVFPASGRGDAATITQGIIYASQMGATVMNMSFGGNFRSFTMENALLSAYPSSMLVAAAGNDGKSIYDIDKFGNPCIFYPAAFTIVFGVQTPEPYSNYDPDGPVLSLISEGFNYELTAPGNVLSTIPNGNYKVLSGTSMASPIVAGSIALYRSLHPDKTLEELWSDFVHSSNNIINLQNVLFNNSTSPRLDLVSFEINDQNEDCDKDGKADAGETISLILKIRNTGQPSQNVYAKIKPAIDGNVNDIRIIKDSVKFGSIGIYRTQTNDSIPFTIQISNECMNNSYASIDVDIHNSVDSITMTQNIKFKIYNGQELSGILIKDTTLTADKNWVISNNLRISTGVTITIEPGTTIEVLAGVDNRGHVMAIGSQENRIKMKGSIGGNVNYKYADIDLLGGDLSGEIIEYCNLENLSKLQVKRLKYSKIINVIQGYSGAIFQCDTIYRCYIENSYLEAAFHGNIYESIVDNFIISFTNTILTTAKWNFFNNVKNIYAVIYPSRPDIYSQYPTHLFVGSDSNRNYKNTFLNNGISTYFIKTVGSDDLVSLPNHYWGTNDINKIKPKYYDFTNSAGLPYLNVEPKLSAPSDSCHGHVWKVLVNGKDAQDEFVEPVGVGNHRFDVFFNRAMDKTITPQITFGGIYPYTSIPINENGTWSEDGKIYTVYKTIKLTTGDGINRIRVAGAKQDADWGWEIPVEDQRFNFVIAAATSASTDFMATPGLGKVALEWNDNDLEDGLGYNMYRMEHINDSTLTQPVIVNSSLITDTLYTDFSVVPNRKYYYYYKILRTNMAETDSSRVVSAIPFTASKGDANGDLSVNVLDITTIVAYLLNNNPQPFIYEAADVNSDTHINVLDIVGVVNLVLNVPQNAPSIAMNKQVDLYISNDTLFADSNVDIAAIQLDIAGIEKFEDITILDALKAFESGNSYANETLRVIFYSMTGKTIEAGQAIPLLKLKSGSFINDAIFGESNGSPVKVNYIMTRIPDISANMNQYIAELGQNYPNPVNGYTTIPVRIYEPIDEIVLRVINMMGQEVDVIRMTNPLQGENLINWNSGHNKGLFLYKLEIRQGTKRSVCPAKRMMIK